MQEIVRLKKIADSLKRESDQIYAIIANLEKANSVSLSAAQMWTPEEFAQALNEQAGRFLSDQVPISALLFAPNHVYRLGPYQAEIAASPDQELIATWQGLISATNRKNKFMATRPFSALMQRDIKDVGQARKIDDETLSRSDGFNLGLGKSYRTFLRTSLAKVT